MANRPKKQHISSDKGQNQLLFGVRFTDSSIAIDMRKVTQALENALGEIDDNLQQDTISDKRKSALQNIRKEINTAMETLEKRQEDTTTRKYISPRVIVPKSHIDQTSKLMNVLTEAKPLNGLTELRYVVDVSKGGAEKKVETSCILTYEGDNIQINGKRPFTEFDRCVYNAVTSLYAAGNKYITPATVWRTMTGKTDTEKPTDTQKTAVLESLDKMRFMRARIDCSDEFKMHKQTINGEPVNGGVYDDNLLHLSSATFETRTRYKKEKHEVEGQQLTEYEVRSKKYEAFEILAEPILYRYSAVLKQVINVPLKLLDIKKLDKKGMLTTRSAEYTERRSILANYLIRRIEGMKANERGRNRQDNRCIRYRGYTRSGNYTSGIYDISGNKELSQPIPDNISEADYVKRRNNARYIREDVRLILENWTQTGYIKGYSEYKIGKDVAGVKVDI